ncbi:MAG: 50S ribosomal protein L28 [Candidatus Magasanikbacteria bacterium]|nr:50S ribosomal protein L28 [Candidatus Magasanikbacteria bacterium]NCS72188.1 50S ribosomal protein L28 [Candidatus Magasanikbacteria bacterium]
MARTCDLLGTGVSTANNVSHSKRRTKRTQSPNLQQTSVYLAELDRTLKLKLSKKALKTIAKHGGLAVSLRQVSEAGLSNTLYKIKKQLLAK